MLLAWVVLAGAGCGDDGPAAPGEVTDTLRFTVLTAGARHTCGLQADGKALCWGFASDGQLGVLTTGGVFTPTEVETNLRFTDIAAGSQHTCGLTADGTVYCWGRASWIISPFPVRVSGEVSFTSVESRFAHVCGVTTAGDVACFGAADRGQLGPTVAPDEGRSTAAVTVPGLVGTTAVTTGRSFSCALDGVGSAWCWGLDETGQLGRAALSQLCDIRGFDTPCSFEPTKVAAAGAYQGIAAGLYHACGLLQVGDVECWGDDGADQLGRDDLAPEMCTWVIDGPGTTRSCDWSPRSVSGDVAFVSLTAGSFHTCGVTESGGAFCWGSNEFGQLGGGPGGGGPTVVVGGHEWVSLSGGQVHTCGLTTSGAAYCWGDGSWGQLGSISQLSAVPNLVRRFE